MKNRPDKDKPCTHCGRYNNRGLTVDAIVIREGKVLLVKRANKPHKGYWGTPGGFVEWNERVEETVRRELKEETNLTATNLKLIGVYSSPDRHPKQAISVAFLVEAKGKEIKGSDAEELEWFPPKSLPENLAFDHAKIIKDASRLI
ncbi:MAG: NUDIX hydrolase [Candidatus Woesebacteria bacterium]|jgi:8-oxo-dGTP diphosphatase